MPSTTASRSPLTAESGSMRGKPPHPSLPLSSPYLPPPPPPPSDPPPFPHAFPPLLSSSSPFLLFLLNPPSLHLALPPSRLASKDFSGWLFAARQQKILCKNFRHRAYRSQMASASAYEFLERPDDSTVSPKYAPISPTSPKLWTSGLYLRAAVDHGRHSRSKFNRRAHRPLGPRRPNRRRTIFRLTTL